MFEAADARAPAETGGMLLGYISPDGSDIAVTHLVGAGPEAVHRRNSFEPDAIWQQGQLNRIYQESGYLTTYLGDWHSHPEGSPTPSREDTRTARRVARYQGSRIAHPLTIILGGSRSEGSEIAVCYRYWGRKLHVVELRLMSA
jgi:integrative and conjugative element protein (TIGR02256 family)